MEWKPIKEWTDMPEQAGVPFLATIENGFSQLHVAVLFLGYGDGKIYTCDYNYAVGKEEGEKYSNMLSDAWKILAWMPLPDAYNPYEIDVRYLIGELSEKVEANMKTIEIKDRLIPMIESHLLWDDPKRKFYLDWRKRFEDAYETYKKSKRAYKRK